MYPFSVKPCVCDYAVYDIREENENESIVCILENLHNAMLIADIMNKDENNPGVSVEYTTNDYNKFQEEYPIFVDSYNKGKL